MLGFSLSSLCLASVLDTRFLVWILMISIACLYHGQFSEKLRWYSSQWWHMISLLPQVFRLCSLALHRTQIGVDSRQRFTVWPYFRALWHIIGLSKYSYTSILNCSPRMLMNFGGSFSLKVRISGVAVIFTVFIRKPFCTRTRSNASFRSVLYCSKPESGTF